MTKKVKTPLYSFANFCLKLARKWPLDSLNYSLDSPKSEKENALIVKTKRARNRTLEQTQLEAIYQRKRYKDYKRLGICVSRSRKAKTGLLYCQVCLARMRERKMLQRPLFCPECNKLIRPEDRNGRKFHKQCAEKRQSRRYPQIHKSAALAYQERHRKLGLCTNCPRKVFKSGLCRKHYRMAQERYYERAAG